MTSSSINEQRALLGRCTVKSSDKYVYSWLSLQIDTSISARAEWTVASLMHLGRLLSLIWLAAIQIQSSLCGTSLSHLFLIWIWVWCSKDRLFTTYSSILEGTFGSCRKDVNLVYKGQTINLHQASSSKKFVDIGRLIKGPVFVHFFIIGIDWQFSTLSLLLDKSICRLYFKVYNQAWEFLRISFH